MENAIPMYWPVYTADRVNEQLKDKVLLGILTYVAETSFSQCRELHGYFRGSTILISRFSFVVTWLVVSVYS